MQIFWVLIFINLLYGFNQITIESEIQQNGIMLSGVDSFCLYDHSLNLLSVYDYSGNLRAKKELDFLQLGDNLVSMRENSAGGYYFFCSNSKKLYQTDKNFNLIRNLTLPIDETIKLSSLFYENSVQNLIFIDIKNNGFYALIQSKLHKMWTENDSFDDIIFSSGRVYLLNTDRIVVKGENGIRYSDIVLPKPLKKITLTGGNIYGIGSDGLYSVSTETNEIKKYDLNLPECRFLESKGGHLLYATKDSVFILKLGSEDNE